jgi:FAD/FMN-containing dehydrogenase
MNLGEMQSDLSKDSETDRESVTSQDRARSFFRDNYERLQEIKKKYDPDVVFDRWLVVEPKA